MQLPGKLIVEQFGRTDPRRVHGLAYNKLGYTNADDEYTCPVNAELEKILMFSSVENTKYF